MEFTEKELQAIRDCVVWCFQDWLNGKYDHFSTEHMTFAELEDFSEKVTKIRG